MRSPATITTRKDVASLFLIPFPHPRYNRFLLNFNYCWSQLVWDLPHEVFFNVLNSFTRSEMRMTSFIFVVRPSLICEWSDDRRTYNRRMGLARRFLAAPMPILSRLSSVFPATFTRTFPIPIRFRMAHRFLFPQRLRG
jgi:hypothetical protein